MVRFRRSAGLAFAAVLIGSTTAFAQDMGAEQAYMVSNQGDEPRPEAVLLTAENATIERREDGVTVTLTMPTPEARKYAYPDGIKRDRKAQPEAFTGWAFIFNDPASCTSNMETPKCGADDGPMVVNFAGHMNSVGHTGGDFIVNDTTGGMLVLTGDIPLGDALTNPMGAEIHAAIAPHGKARIGKLDEELTSPAGSPDCACWWVASFVPAGIR